MTGESELGVGGDHQPGPSIRRVGTADAGCGPAESLFEEPESVFQIERRRNACHSWFTCVAVVAVAECHSHSGFGVPVPGSRSTWSRITVPSMIGSGQSWSAQAPVWVSLGCNRSQERACAVP